jgi:hypothetical protein
MSTRLQDTGNGLGNVMGQTASKAASMIDERVHWGADAVSNMAHQAAGQVGKASDYVWKKSEGLRDRAAGVSELASNHPVCTLVAVGMIGFGVGFLLRGRGRV